MLPDVGHEKHNNNDDDEDVRVCAYTYVFQVVLL